jgi:hypothetical protein
MSLDGGVKMFSGFCVAKDDLRHWRWEERDAAGGDPVSPRRRRQIRLHRQ